MPERRVVLLRCIVVPTLCSACDHAQPLLYDHRSWRVNEADAQMPMLEKKRELIGVAEK